MDLYSKHNTIPVQIMKKSTYFLFFYVLTLKQQNQSSLEENQNIFIQEQN